MTSPTSEVDSLLTAWDLTPVDLLVMRNHDNTLTLLDRVMNGRPVIDLDAERKARK